MPAEIMVNPPGFKDSQEPSPLQAPTHPLPVTLPPPAAAPRERPGDIQPSSRKVALARESIESLAYDFTPCISNPAIQSTLPERAIGASKPAPRRCSKPFGEYPKASPNGAGRG